MEWFRLVAVIAWLGIFVIWPQPTAAFTLLLGGGVFIAFNAMIFWQTVVQKEHAPAVAPIFGGILGAIGVALLPFPETYKWAWVPLVIDWGGLPLLVVGLYQRWSK
jgi:hypothetical protein